MGGGRRRPPPQILQPHRPGPRPRSRHDDQLGELRRRPGAPAGAAQGRSPMTKDAAMAHLDTYLAQVRRGLKGLSEAEIREVLLELRAHVLDKVEGNLTPRSVETALAELGSPRDVARINVTERVAAV